MTEKQFIIPEGCRIIKNIKTGEVAIYYDTTDGLMFLKWLNNLSEENEQLKNKLKFFNELNKPYGAIIKENEQLKQSIKKLEKQIHLIHMASMFSTVKSFKGDVSKRYKYSEETDTIYDTANRYGQYSKILDKKEVVMLLNEYETLLRDD